MLWWVFFVNGAVLSSWAPRIPAVAASLDLSDRGLGIALFGIAAGSVPALLVTGRLIRRRRATTLCLSGFAFAAGLPLIAAADSLVTLTVVLVLLGAAGGTLDIAMNTAAVRWERTIAPRRVLSRLHGGYSTGVLVGAGGATLAADVPVGLHFTVVAGVLVVVLAVVVPRLPAETPADAPTRTRRAARPAVLVLAVGALFLEGVVTDWSALLAARDLGAGPTAGAAVVTTFTVAMALSRTLTAGTRTAAVAGVLLAVVAVPAALVLAHPAVFLAAAACVGAGLGPLFPAAVGASGDIATVTAVGYCAYLAGPPVLGAAAEAVGLPVAFGVAVSVVGVVVAMAARRCLPRRHSGERAE
ncbi:MFS transporter [Saccharothrix violaceirubra]